MTALRPINILHIIDKLSMDGINPSSCTILLGDWFSHFKADQFHLTVCTLRSHDPAGKYLEKQGLKVHCLDFGKYSFKNVRGIAELIEAEQADIVHLHGYSAANFGRIAARRKNIPNVVHEHAVLKVLPPQYLVDFLLRNYTDAAVAVSGNVKDFMIRARSIPPSKIRVIGNGIRIDKYKRSDVATIQRKRSELGIPDRVRVVGTVTRLREEKGNEYFIRAMPQVLREFPDTVFIIVGDGPLREWLEALTRELNVAHQVKFLGFRTDVVELLSIFDVNVISSLSEGFGLSLVEAMSVENAIVATSVGGMKEIATDGETVLFIPPKDPTEIGGKVSFLLKNPDIAIKISKQAKQGSMKFSIETNVASLGELYQSMKW